MPAAQSAEPGDRPVRVALDTSYAGTNPTGVGLYSRRLAEALRSLAPEHELDLRCYGPSCRAASGRHSLSDLAQEWPLYTHGVLPARLAAFKPNVVHATSHIGPLWGAGKLVVTVHDLIFFRRPGDYSRAWLALTRLFLPRVLRRAAAVACDSQATRDDLISRLGVPGRKTVVIYPGIDGHFARSPSAGAILPYPYILCLGPLVRRKNLDVAIKAFAVLARDHANIRLVITGGPSPGVQSYTEAEITALLPDSLRERLVLTGYVGRRELAKLVSGASVLAYPSLDEGFGLPPLEAMAAGVPVVVADTPAVVEATGGAALVAPHDSPSEWADRLSLVLERHDVAERLRAAGLKQSSRYTWKSCALEFAALYRRLAVANARGTNQSTSYS
jgi:glycosyltransferase involved in cell wall biosynthesis